MRFYSLLVSSPFKILSYILPQNFIVFPAQFPFHILSHFFAKKLYCISSAIFRQLISSKSSIAGRTGKVLFVKVERGRSLCEARCSPFHSPVCWALLAFLLQFCIFIFLNRTIFSCRFPSVSPNIGLFSHCFSRDLNIKIRQSRFVWFSLITYRSDILVPQVVTYRCLAIRLEQIFDRKIEDLNLDEK